MQANKPSCAELKKLAEAKRVSLTKGEKELSPDELDAVSGGVGMYGFEYEGIVYSFGCNKGGVDTNALLELCLKTKQPCRYAAPEGITSSYQCQYMYALETDMPVAP